MLTLNDAKAIYVYPGTTDMRYGINALYSLADQPEEKTIVNAKVNIYKTAKVKTYSGVLFFPAGMKRKRRLIMSLRGE